MKHGSRPFCFASFFRILLQKPEFDRRCIDVSMIDEHHLVHFVGAVAISSVTVTGLASSESLALSRQVH